MSDPHILHLETSTNVCSVAMSKGGQLLAIRETNEDRSHGKLLTIFMREVLEEAGITISQVDAVSISKGPGSYTGLRIGVSTAKGFAFAQSIPVIGIITLEAMALGARNVRKEQEDFDAKNELLCPMIDARRMEVFTALYDQSLKPISPVEAKILDESSFGAVLEKHPVLFFGNGAAKLKAILDHNNGAFLDGFEPSAKYMIPLALEKFRAGDFEDTAYFEPFYLKDFVATIPKRKVL